MNAFSRIAPPNDVRYGDYNVNLLAGIPYVIQVPGDYWQLIKTPGGEIEILMDDSERIVRQAPSGGPGNYRRVTLTSALSQAVVIALGHTNGLTPYDSGTIVSGSFEVLNKIPSLNRGLADIAIAAGGTGTFVQNLTRDSLIVSLDDNAPDYVRVCSGAAGEGVRLYPGGSKTIQTKGAVVVRNPNAVVVTVSASETYN